MAIPQRPARSPPPPPPPHHEVILQRSARFPPMMASISEAGIAHPPSSASAASSSSHSTCVPTININTAKAYYNGGCVMLHIQDEHMDNKRNVLVAAASMMIARLGGRISPAPMSEGEEGSDSLSLTILDVPCCYSKATGCADVTCGIAGRKSKIQAKNEIAKTRVTRFFLRGVTANGCKQEAFQRVLHDMEKIFSRTA